MEVLEKKVANQLATGAPGTIRIGGDVYLAAQPTKADFTTLGKFLTSLWKKQYANPISAVAEELQSMSPELRQLAIEAGAISRAVDRKNGNRSPEPGDLAQMLMEPEAAAFWAWHLCRKNHPELKLSTVEAIAKNEANPEAAADLLADLLTATAMKDTDPNGRGETGSKS